MRRRTRAARDRLLVLLTRLAQMHMDVGQSGQDHLLGTVDHLGARRLERATEAVLEMYRGGDYDAVRSALPALEAVARSTTDELRREYLVDSRP